MRPLVFLRPAHLAAAAVAALLLSSPFASAAARAQTPAPSGPASQADILTEIRVHGNYATTDTDVVRLAGVTIGQPLGPAEIAAVAKRLRDSGRFQAVELRKRSRSLADTHQVVLIILVEEFPTQDTGDLTPPGPMRRLKEKLMFLPILGYEDGYGFTYGGRASFVHLLGQDGRVSVPLTWGGSKRAAVEIEKTFRDGPMSRVFSRVDGGAAVSRRENPYFGIDDDRQELWVHADRAVLRDLRVGGGIGWTDVSFAALDDRFVRYGLDVTFDTRQDPTFPRNAVYGRAAWEALDFREGPTVGRTSLEGRGYLGVFGQNVVSVRARLDRADQSLPPYEQALLGGASTLRGFRAGSFAGDNRLVSSVELRVPFTSPFSVGKTGLDVFFDSGAVWRHGQRLRDADVRHGVGAGLFFFATIFQLSADVAHGLDAGWRFHLMSGFQF